MTFRNALDAEIGVAQLGVAEKGEWLKKKKEITEGEELKLWESNLY